MVRPASTRGTPRWAAGLLLAAASAAGCGDGGPPGAPLHPASGKVLVDGRPIAGVQVRLHPADRPGSLDAQVPFATTSEDGGFTLGTYEKGDGAPEGRYKLTLFWPDRPPGPQPAEDQLGGNYATPDKTPVEATIAGGENTIPTIEVPKSAVRTTRPGKPKRGARADNDGLE